MTTRAEPSMGTVVGVTVREDAMDVMGAADLASATEPFYARLRELEAVFSPWRADSEISRIARGELRETDATPDVRWVLGVCDHLADRTAGAFSARRRGAVRPLDPSGFVKGWAVEEAAELLDVAGLRDYAINAGGDILIRAHPGSERRWRVGIRDPRDATRVITSIEVERGAVATSGLYERGDHVVDARTGAPPRELSSVTVVGPSLAWADAYATCALLLGGAGLDWVDAIPGYGAIAITASGDLLATPVADRLLDPVLRNISASDGGMASWNPPPTEGMRPSSTRG
jgi:thiamine biosynthesis lipoprotein